MEQLTIGLGEQRLSTEETIVLWSSVSDGLQRKDLARTSIPALFGSSDYFLGLAKGARELGYWDLEEGGQIVSPEKDYEYLRLGFNDGLEAALATYTAIRLMRYPKYKATGDPDYRLPKTFEPQEPGRNLFTQENDTFAITMAQLMQILIDYVPIDKSGYDPQLSYMIGSEFGTQFALQCLAKRYMDLRVKFEIEDLYEL